MHSQHKKFLHEAEKVSFDKKHRATIRFNMSRYDASVKKGQQIFSNIDLARKRVAYLKRKSLQQLDNQLLEFEKNISARGVKVIWAKNSQEALDAVLRIAKANEASHIVKSKSMTTEEIELNSFLESADIQSVETDLGEYIVQLAGEKPYHIVTPAMHKSRQDIADLFQEKFDIPPNSSPEYITNFVRKLLRKKFVSAKIGITGANFLIADTGSIALTENEGNGIMSMAFPKIHIVIAGIEKLVPSFADMGLFWQVLATHGTGQELTTYNTIVSGARQSGETDGAEEMYVILLDNGRSKLLHQLPQRDALACIRCGACLNACPVYRNIGGYTYDATYSGPIGSVITPHFNGIQAYKHLSFACTLCGKCYEVCAAKINLPELLLYNRRDAIKEQARISVEKLAIKGFVAVASSRPLFDFAPVAVRNYFAKIAGTKIWGERRKLPTLKQSFAKQWKKRTKQL